MLAKINSCALLGVEAVLVEVECDVRGGMPTIALVGLPSTSVKESKDRVWSAIRNSGMRFPGGHVTVNLAPADMRKDGPAYDLPIALGLLAASGHFDPSLLDGALVLGELSLDGSVRHVRGVISAVQLARRIGLERVFVPAIDAAEASLIPDVTIYPADHLISVVEHLLDLDRIPPFDRSQIQYESQYPDTLTDFADVKGQEHVKRALEVAAAGAHNVLMTGPPGSGKTLLARAIPAILPDMTIDEALEVTQVFSVADMLPAGTPLMRHRPFRAPHHTISHAGLIGGGSIPRPGEISLAHRGVLFLDELPEFGRALETLRQPLEDRSVTISRAAGSMVYPCNFILIAAANPCPCGYHGDTMTACTCSPGMIARYQQRLSGPLLDRIDIHVEVPRVAFEKLSDIQRNETSESVRARIQAARDRQRTRFQGTPSLTNADMGSGDVQKHVPLTQDGLNLMKAAMAQMQLSARAYHRVLKISRTIADLDSSEQVHAHHLAEALQYRARIQE